MSLEAWLPNGQPPPNIHPGWAFYPGTGSGNLLQKAEEILKVLTVTNLYPTADKPFMSTFVKEQVECMRELFPDLTIHVRVIEGDKPKGEYIREMLRLPAVVKKGGYDIVHGHFGLTLISFLFLRVPTVITLVGSDVLVSPTKHVSKFLVRKASRVIVVAQRLRDHLGCGEVIPYGIRVEDFLLPARYGASPSPGIPGELKVLFPSNPARKEKNYDLYSAVCRELERRGNRVKEVHLCRIARYEDVPKLYWDCDIMILSSLSEGSPTVIKEAIAAKLPFVSVDVGDVKDWARLVDFGEVVPDRNPKTIADAVISLLSRIKQRQSLDNSKCLEAMDSARIAARMRRLYQEVFEEQFK